MTLIPDEIPAGLKTDEITLCVATAPGGLWLMNIYRLGNHTRIKITLSYNNGDSLGEGDFAAETETDAAVEVWNGFAQSKISAEYLRAVIDKRQAELL